MGMYGGSSTQQTELPPPTDEQLRLQATEFALIEAMLGAQGLDLIVEEEVVFENQARVDALNENKELATQQLNELQDQLNGLRQQGAGSQSQQVLTLQGRIDQANRELRNINTQLSEEQSKTTTRFNARTEEREDPRVQQLLDQGKTAEANSLRQQLAQQETDILNQQDSIVAGFLDAAEKFVSGDLSITERQQDEINSIVGAFRDPIMSAIDSIKTEIGITEGVTLAELEARRLTEGAEITRTFEGVSAALDGLEEQIRQTGLDTVNAIAEAEARAKASGQDIKAGFEQTIAASRELAEKNLFEATKDMRIQNAQLAASLGRSDLDSQFVERLNEQVVNAVTVTELNLALEQARGSLQIDQDTAATLQGLANFRIDVASSQGQRLEGVQAGRAQLEADTGLRREALARDIGQQRAAVRESAGLRREEVAKLRAGTEEAASALGSQLRLDLAQPLRQLTAGQGLQSQFTSLGALPFQQLLGSTGATSNALRSEVQQRIAQPTTTTTSSGNFFGGLLGTLGAGASAFGSISTGIGALR